MRQYELVRGPSEVKLPLHALEVGLRIGNVLPTPTVYTAEVNLED